MNLNHGLPRTDNLENLTDEQLQNSIDDCKQSATNSGISKLLKKPTIKVQLTALKTHQRIEYGHYAYVNRNDKATILEEVCDYIGEPSVKNRAFMSVQHYMRKDLEEIPNFVIPPSKIRPPRVV